MSLLKYTLVKISVSTFIVHSPNSYFGSIVIQSYIEPCVSYNNTNPLTGNNTQNCFISRNLICQATICYNVCELCYQNGSILIMVDKQYVSDSTRIAISCTQITRFFGNLLNEDHKLQKVNTGLPFRHCTHVENTKQGLPP